MIQIEYDYTVLEVEVDVILFVRCAEAVFVANSTLAFAL